MSYITFDQALAETQGMIGQEVLLHLRGSSKGCEDDELLGFSHSNTEGALQAHLSMLSVLPARTQEDAGPRGRARRFG